MREFRANFYRPDSASAEPVSLTVGGNRVIVLKEGKESNVLSFERIALRLGGQNGKRLVITDQDSGITLIAEDLTILDEIDKFPGGHAMAARIKEIRATAAQMPRKELRNWGLCLLSVIVIGLIIFASVDAFVALAAKHIPADVEGQLGALILKSYRSNHKVLESGPDVARVRRIVDRLNAQVSGSRYKLHAYVEPSPDVNAFAMPGGNIMVLSGLLSKAEDDSEVAGVIGHEIGHVTGRHSLKAALHQAGLIACFGLIFQGQGKDQAAWLSQFINLEQLQFSRAQEDEADRIGVELTCKADYDPQGLLRFFEKIQSEGSGSPLHSKALEILSTHPYTAERITRIRREIARVEGTKRKRTQAF